MSLSIPLVPKTFTEGHQVQPSSYGSSTIFNGGQYAYVTVGDLENQDVVRLMQTATVASQPAQLIENVSQRIPGIHGQITVQLASGVAVGADTKFDWMVTKF